MKRLKITFHWLASCTANNGKNTFKNPSSETNENKIYAIFESCQLIKDKSRKYVADESAKIKPPFLSSQHAATAGTGLGKNQCATALMANMRF